MRVTVLPFDSAGSIAVSGAGATRNPTLRSEPARLPGAAPSHSVPRSRREPSGWKSSRNPGRVVWFFLLGRQRGRCPRAPRQLLCDGCEWQRLKGAGGLRQGEQASAPEVEVEVTVFGHTRPLLKHK